jgi:hypothetical protein
MEPISPELALVDPPRGPGRASRSRIAPSASTLSIRVSPESASTAPQPVTGSRKWSARRLFVCGVVVASLLGVTAAGPLDSSSTVRLEAAAGQDPVATTTAASAQTSSRTIRWSPVVDADFYNVILWRDGARVLDLWPRATRVRLTTDRLPPGTYTWFVYPGFSSDRFGPVAAHGEIRIGA